uniref:DH domain-containing protein n=2 Tax=Meloidogyne TaxID=189290 RepID=A0A914L968_MELIC
MLKNVRAITFGAPCNLKITRHDFHHSILLPSLHQNSNSAEGVSTVLSSQRKQFSSLYRQYCKNKPTSDDFIGEHKVDKNKFILDCQRSSGHPLPLSTYLLKHIQRITKYQLLLKELIKHCPTEQSLQHVQTALTSMMGLLTRIYASMEHLVLLGYSGDCLGSLRLKTEATISIFHRAKAGAKTANSGRKKGNEQEMHLLYFDGGILLCDLQTTTTTQDCQYFIHKFCIPVESLGFAKNSRNSNERFEIWDTKSGNSAKYCFVIKISNEDIRKMLIRKLSKKLL